MLLVHYTAERPFRKINARDHPLADVAAGIETLLADVVHDIRTGLSFGIAGEVLHFAGDGQLATGLHALNDDGFQTRARGINSCGIAGRAGTDDKTFDVFHLIFYQC